LVPKFFIATIFHLLLAYGVIFDPWDFTSGKLWLMFVLFLFFWPPLFFVEIVFVVRRWEEQRAQ